ncbi:unnamed protein product [Alternaria alternata]
MRELAKQRDKKTFISLEREDREKRDQIAFRTEPYFFAVAGLPAVPPLRDNHGFRGADVGPTPSEFCQRNLPTLTCSDNLTTSSPLDLKDASVGSFALACRPPEPCEDYQLHWG